MDLLATILLDLAFELEGRSIPFMIGGGYGLYLKRQHLVETGERTLFGNLPSPRATNDLDMFLRAEVLADLERTRSVRDAIVSLGYQPVATAKFLQWKREFVVGGIPQEVKIDSLVGPLGEHRSRMKVTPPRARPRGTIEFHAHTVEEAISLEDQPVKVRVSGLRSHGEPYTATVDVPDAFPYLMMKLHAYDDRKNDTNKDLGRHHALDAYTIVGLMTEAEYDRARQIGAQSLDNSSFQRSCGIVAQDFVDLNSLGILRIREHPLFRPEFELDQFRSVLREIFPD